jgi:hypothetical protein
MYLKLSEPVSRNQTRSDAFLIANYGNARLQGGIQMIGGYLAGIYTVRLEPGTDSPLTDKHAGAVN